MGLFVNHLSVKLLANIIEIALFTPEVGCTVRENLEYATVNQQHLGIFRVQYWVVTQPAGHTQCHGVGDRRQLGVSVSTSKGDKFCGYVSTNLLFHSQ